MDEQRELPTGKSFTRDYDAEGRIRKESHSYGMLDIGITMEFDKGVKVSEMYFVKRRMVSRERYEKARAEYADMPAPDVSVEDLSGDLLKGVRAERRQLAKAAKQHKPDPAEAARIDSFCETMLKTGLCADAIAWVASDQHNLGELSPAKSRKLVENLVRAGAKSVYACEIDQYDDGDENTGHLVIELPEDAARRKALLREVDRLAAKQGHRGEFENHQRYAYLKLD